MALARGLFSAIIFVFASSRSGLNRHPNRFRWQAAQAPNPPHKGEHAGDPSPQMLFEEGHRSFFVRENPKGLFYIMDMSSPTTPEVLNGSDILVRCLQAEGVKYMWGYPGGAVLYIYDALYKQDTIQHVLVRHEQAAVHAADGYARATGDVGVALVTSGPGVTNAITGIATAYMDSIPMVIITGQVPTPAIGLDAFQECDTVGITRPIVKHNFLVKDVADLAVTMKKAFHIARTGRPGPVVVDVPKDVSLNKTAFSYPETVEMRSYNPVRKGHGGQIRKAVQLILGAKRPYIYTGGGVILANAANELRELVNLLGYPTTSTLMGLGAIAASDKTFLGMLGMHGTYEANMTMQSADVVLAVGARFDDRVIGNPKHFAQVERKIIHIDIDPSSISKRVKVDIPIVGDVKDVLIELIAQIKESTQRADPNALATWWNQIGEWKKRECLKYKTSDEVIKPQFVVETLARLTVPFLPADVQVELDSARNARACGLFKDRCSTLVELAAWLQLLVTGRRASDEDIRTHVTDAVRPALAELGRALATCEWTQGAIAAAIKQILAETGLKMPQLAMPARVLLMGTPQTPSLDAVLALIARQDAVSRLSAV